MFSLVMAGGGGGSPMDVYFYVHGDEQWIDSVGDLWIHFLGRSPVQLYCINLYPADFTIRVIFREGME